MATSRTITCYPTYSGSSMLIEFKGSAYDVVALDVLAVPPTSAQLLNLKLIAVAGVGLSSLGALSALLSSWRLLPTLVRYADGHGVAHVIAPSQGLVSGDQVRVSGALLI